MAVLARLYDFTAGQPILSSEVDNEFNQLVNALNATSTSTNLIVRYNNSTGAPLRLDQLGTGPILQFYASGVSVGSVKANGQIETLIATGTAPLSVSSTTKVSNLNVDAVDGYHVPTTFAAIAGSLTPIYTTAGNSAGSGDTDLHSKTLAANTFANNGDVLHAAFGGSVAANGNAKRIRLQLDGADLLDTGSLTSLGNTFWRLDLSIIRIDSDSIKALSMLTTQSGTTQSFASYVQVNGYNFATTKTLKIVGNGVSANDVVQEVTTLTFVPGA